MTLPTDPVAWAARAFNDDRAGDYALYRRYIDGDQPMKYELEQFRRAFGRHFDRFAYNRCAYVVDAHADRMQVSGFGANNDTHAEAAQELWDDNEMDVREGQVDTEAFGLGDGYLLVDKHPVTGNVYLWPQRADQIRVRYDEEQPGVVELAAKAWRDEDDHTRLNLYFIDRIEKYRSINRTPGGMPRYAADFEQYQPENDTRWPVPLDIAGTVPVFHFANNGRVNEYGVSELRAVLPLQDMLNLDLLKQAVAGSFRAQAQWVLLNYDANDPQSKTALENLKVGVTTALAIPPNPGGEASPQIAEFSAADMEQFDLITEKWDIRISRVSRVPVHHLTMLGSFPSGESLRMAESPFVSKIRDRQRAFQGIYAAAITYGLQLQGIPIAPGDLRVNWESATPLGQAETWDIAEAQVRAGMPFEQVLKERGYEPEQITDILEMKARDAERVAAQFNLGAFGADYEDAP